MTRRIFLYPEVRTLAGVDHCDECGFVYASVEPHELAGQLAAVGVRYAAALEQVPELRRRPAPSVWSALEYTCHVRDVLRVQKKRLALALQVDNPEFPPMGRDELAVANAYNDQDPAVVLVDLADAASRLALAFAVLQPEQWNRTGMYNWPTRERRTMLWLGRHTLHEVEHHLLDISRSARP